MAKVEPKTNADPPANGGDKDKSKTEIEELKATNQQQLLANQEMQRQLDEMKGMIISPQYQEFMQVKNKPKDYDPSGFAAGRQEVDFDTMDNAQLVQHIMGAVSEVIQGTVSPQLDKIKTDRQRDLLARGIKDARSTYKDFDNYAAQMSQTSARIERTGITADDIYRITTHGGAPKTEPPKGKDDKGATTEPPTSGAVGTLTADGKEKTAKDIAGEVWDKIIGNKG